MAQGLVDALTSASSAEDAAAAYGALGAAQAALHAATNLPANQIAALQAQINQLVLDLEAANATPSTETVALETAQADAVTAAAEAMEAATAAKVASDAAQTAIENLATLQTGETSRGLAHAAYAQAKAAADAAAEAQTASDGAAEATNGVAATRLLVMAETARDNAVAAQGMAETRGAAAMAGAMEELMIVGTVKTVGGTSLDATAGSTSSTSDGQTTVTGLLPKGDQPMHTVVASATVPGVTGNPDADMDPYEAPVAAAAERKFPIGKLVDSADDLARLMIVTQYAGAETVNVYSQGTAAPLQGDRGTKAGYVTIDDGVPSNGAGTDGADQNNVALRSEGTYYPNGTDTGALDEAVGEVAFNATGKEVFSFVDPDTSRNEAGAKTYVVLLNEVKVGTTTTYNYVNADIYVEDVDMDGDDATNNLHKVTAEIPEATDYKHIHFGVWAALGDPEKDGTQELSDLGIGFVQSIGDGLTAIGGGIDDMPNGGKATYKGDWVAAVQKADRDGNGAMSLEHKRVQLEADFGMATINVDLMGLAKLEGEIDTNTFDGTKATVAANDYGLTPAGKFTGTFSGGFYGAKAAEAGGIFDFTSEDAEAGAFRGAFGGDKQ